MLVTKLVRRVARLVNKKLQAKFGYQVAATTDSWNVFVHTSWSLSEALEWAACYPVDDFLYITCRGKFIAVRGC